MEQLQLPRPRFIDVVGDDKAPTTEIIHNFEWAFIRASKVS